MEPVCCGLRSPAGVQNSPWGDMFYTDNQGEWCGASKLSLLEPGSFQGHPHGIESCRDPRWPWDHPGEVPNRVLMPTVGESVPTFHMPAVWFPFDKMGRSPAGFVWDRTGGRFGRSLHPESSSLVGVGRQVEDPRAGVGQGSAPVDARPVRDLRGDLGGVPRIGL